MHPMVGDQMDPLSFFNQAMVVMQEATIQIIKHNNSLCNKEEDNKMHFQTWLFTITTSQVIKIKTQKTTLRMEIIEWVAPHSSSTLINYHSLFNLQALPILLMLAMAKIRDKRRAKLVLRHYKGK